MTACSFTRIFYYYISPDWLHSVFQEIYLDEYIFFIAQSVSEGFWHFHFSMSQRVILSMWKTIWTHNLFLQIWKFDLVIYLICLWLWMRLSEEWDMFELERQVRRDHRDVQYKCKFPSGIWETKFSILSSFIIYQYIL